MADSRGIVTSIDAILKRDNLEQTEEMSRLAHEYAELCTEVNRRLRLCAEYLSFGLRCEAVQLSEESPELQAELAALDFAGLNDWSQLCDDYGLPFQPLLMDIATEVNNAFVDFDQLEPLLLKFRTLNIAQAPLVMRLAYLRKIALIDRDVDFWYADIADHEEARKREILEDCRRYRRRRWLDGLYYLLEEIDMDCWTRPVANATRDRITRAIERVQDVTSSTHRIHVLGRICDALQPLVEAGTGSKIDSLRSKLKRALHSCTLPPDAPSRRRAQKLLQQSRHLKSRDPAARVSSTPPGFPGGGAVVTSALDSGSGITAMGANIQCPYCSEEFEDDPSLHGTVVECTCGKEFVVDN